MSFKIYTFVSLIVCFLLLQMQCKKEKLTDDTYFNSKVMVLGHRGMGIYYKMPGNTYESIAPAIGIGSDGCEIDISLTKDTALILFHDHLLNPMTTCTTRVYELTLDEVKKCKYYAIKDDIFILSMDELFSKLPNLTDLYFSFDCKLDNEVTDSDLYQKQFLRAIKRVCEKYYISNNVFIEGSESFLDTAKKMGLTNKLFLSGNLTTTLIEKAKNNSYFGIVCQMDDFEVSADMAHEKGLFVMGYAPNNYVSNMDAVEKKVDILQTDDPISILKRFERYNYDYVIP